MLIAAPASAMSFAEVTLVFDNGTRVDAALSVRALGGGHGN